MLAPRILVVDDQLINVQLLKRKLEREGITVDSAYSGQEALDAVAAEKPDLILLDVMMPDMDGIEVCTRLQSREETRSIPVIFITARNSKEGKIEGLAVGAVDYITKPIDLDETLARVQTQLRFVSINREMVDLQRRLVEARRAATIGAVTQGIAHNLNNLLGVVIGYLDLIKSMADKPDAVRRNAEAVEKAVQRIVSIIKQLSSMVVKTRLPTKPFKLSDLLRGAIARFEQETGASDVVVLINSLEDLAIDSHIEVFESSFAALITNAWEAYGDSEDNDRTVVIKTAMAEGVDIPTLEIRVEDGGRGIDSAIRDQMFEPFISSKHTVGVGMGLTVARHALRHMGGDLTLHDMPDGGTVAIALHPITRSQTGHG
ncbi:hybrid sensor histidine kinase/response regulator [Synoicihabitans lomoniglobus]|uniref:histidine kinase n=1 Tax=Synoicihabitans lomoniglobus TaxID=2909285 RepID=A0AAF0CR07_9BACT|nr:hybrid sensor histidine kinase/response regulator [Opitutaceae bacterium LMO-M01]WED66482.1 hybrid sensor histidine kinase/response regulator [Opitutaceae bacterium LMO-M01]